MANLTSFKYREDKNDYLLSLGNCTITFLNSIRRNVLNSVSCYSLMPEYPTDVDTVTNNRYDDIFLQGLNIPFGKRRQFAIFVNETSGFHSEMISDRFAEIAINHIYLNDYLERNRDKIGKFFFILADPEDVIQPLVNEDIKPLLVTEKSLIPVYITRENFENRESPIELQTELPQDFDMSECFPYSTNIVVLNKGEMIQGLFEPEESIGYRSERWHPAVISHYSYTPDTDNKHLLSDAQLGIEYNGVMDIKEVLKRAVNSLIVLMDNFSNEMGTYTSEKISIINTKVPYMIIFRIKFDMESLYGDHTLAELLNSYISRDIEELVAMLDIDNEKRLELFKHILIHAHKQHPLDPEIILKIRLGSDTIVDNLLRRYSSTLTGTLVDHTYKSKIIDYIVNVSRKITEDFQTFKNELDTYLEDEDSD